MKRLDETKWSETRDVLGRDRDEIRDAQVRDRDETETLGTLVETRRTNVSRPSRDRDVETETTSLLETLLMRSTNAWYLLAYLLVNSCQCPWRLFTKLTFGVHKEWVKLLQCHPTQCFKMQVVLHMSFFAHHRSGGQRIARCRTAFLTCMAYVPHPA